MKTLYYDETNISHKDPSFKEIKETILSQFYDEDDANCIFDIFKIIKPEKDIQDIIIKNNELTQILVSNEGNSQEEKKKKN